MTLVKSLYTIHMDGKEMAMSVDGGDRPRFAETEKITLNLGHVDLGRIDLLVRDGFYANRTDLMRTAIRNLLDRHDDTVRKSVARDRLEFGLRHYGRAELEAAHRAAAPIEIRVVGLATIAPDVSPDLARASIASIQVLGTLQASAEVRTALRDRML